MTLRFDEVNGNLRNAQVEEMARLMRTSAKYIYSSYRKITDKPVYVATLVRDDNSQAITNATGLPVATAIPVVATARPVAATARPVVEATQKKIRSV